ncbi:MAG TPA: WD40 repeat domain-containing protein, partial [Polyangiaceae bacterium]|nr:WD40 repeat domain-containing protein [Polyangiaceae bacterium]
ARALAAASYQAAVTAGLELDPPTKQMLALAMSCSDAVPFKIAKAFWVRADPGHARAFDLALGTASRLTLLDSRGRYVARNDRTLVVAARFLSWPALLVLPLPAGRIPAGSGAGGPGPDAQLMAWRGPGQIDAVSIDPNSDQVVVVTTEGLALRVDFGASPPVLTELASTAAAAAHTAAVTSFAAPSVALDPTGRWLATATDNVVTVREIAAGAAHAWQATLPVATTTVRGLWLAPTGRLAVWASADTLQIWDPPDPLASTQPPPQGRTAGPTLLTGELRDVEFSANGRRMVTLTPDEIRLWSADPLLQRYTFDASALRALTWRDVVLSQDGQRIGARGADGLLAVWNADSGATLFQRRLGDLQTTAMFSADARSLVLVDRGSTRSIDFETAPSDPELDDLAARIPPARPTQLEVALQDLVPALTQGIRAAKEGRLEEAANHLRDAETWPGVRFASDLRAEITTIRMDALVASTLKAYGEGNVSALQSAIDQLNGLGDAGKKKAAEAAARLAVTHYRQGQHEIGEGHFAEALMDYRAAADADPKAVSAGDWNNLCWEGAIQQSAKKILYACDEAVANAGDLAWNYRDSRGVARAGAGDFAGAVDDLTYRVQHSALYKAERLGWLAALGAGKNPFTDEVLRGLASE